MKRWTGHHLRMDLTGASHAKDVGLVLDGLPAGEQIDAIDLERFMRRRAPGQNALASARTEPDQIEFLSGLHDSKLTGEPLVARIQNKDVRPSDYEQLRDLPRPSHADYPAKLRYGEDVDLRGGGIFSGRMTAPLCIAGGICLQLLKRRGIHIGAHLASVGDVQDIAFDPISEDMTQLLAPGGKPFPVIRDQRGQQMIELIHAMKENQDSIGGVVECMAIGVPGGLGDPRFGALDAALGGMLFSVPGVKGVEIGDGFSAARMQGSQHNDPYLVQNGQIRTATNHAGGMIGGISSGMPIVARAAFKPTSSIGISQQTVHLKTLEQTQLQITGRHDPCIAVRAVPVVESAMAIVLMDSILSMDHQEGATT